MDKAQLREQALQHLERVAATPEDMERFVEHFTARVTLPPTGQDPVVAVYWPLKHEFDIRFLIDDLLKRGVRIALPVASKEGRVMQFSLWDGKTDLVKGAFGIYIPPEHREIRPNIVVLPMLAFDRRGYRLGRGAGHYDATIAHLRTSGHAPLIVGAAYAEQAVLFNLPTEAHDERMDMVVTPRDVFDYRS